MNEYVGDVVNGGVVISNVVFCFFVGVKVYLIIVGWIVVVGIYIEILVSFF